MPEIKIFTPNNNVQPDGTLIFPKDVEEINIRNSLNDAKVDVQKAAQSNFSFPESDYGSVKYTFDENISITNNKTEEIKVSSNTRSQIPLNKQNSFFDSVLNRIDIIITLENFIFGLIVLGCFALRNIFVPFLSGDVTNFLDPWMKHIEENNGFLAFKEKFFDYSPAYVYLLWLGTLFNFSHVFWIKGISIFFDLVIASTVAKIVSLKNPQLWKYSFITTLMFPSVLFNGSFWGQCDVVYSSFVVISLLAILTKKYSRSLFFYGIAFALKSQAIFFLPVFWFLYLFKNIKIWMLGLMAFSCAFIYGLSILPAYLVGRPLLDEVVDGASKNNGLLTIYLNQGKVYGGIVMGSIPNLYQWIDNNKYEYFYQGGIWITLIVLGILSLVFVKQKVSTISNETIVKLSYLTTLAIPYFLPKMHERYMFLADVMCLIYVFWFPKRLWIGVIAGFISYSIYIKHIIGGSVPQFLEPQFNSIYLFGIMAFVLWDILQDFKIKQTV
jgi:Gpi18-like mannosyltransferase